MPGRAQVDVGLPAQRGRPLEVALPVGRVAPIGQAAAVDPFLTACLRQRQIRRLLPRLTGRVQPVPGLGRPALARPALRRGRGVVPLEPLRSVARDAVIAALGEHQVRVGVVRLVGGLRRALVEGERIGQPLPAAHLRGERAGERAPPTRVQFARQSKLDLAVEPPVGALMRVRRLPVGVRVVLRPRGHVAVLHMLAFIAVIGIAPIALDILLARQAALKQELAAKKKALQEAQRRQRDTLTRQIRRAQARLSTADRKRRTRRLILIGSYIDSVSQADPVSMTRLMKGLNEFLERDQDRALFDMAPRQKEAQTENEGSP